MKITSTEADVRLSADVEFEKVGESVRYVDGSSNFRAWKVRVTFKGTSVKDALADPTPEIRVTEGYRVKLDGHRGARASRYHYLAWHNTDRETVDWIIGCAREALTPEEG